MTDRNQHVVPHAGRWAVRTPGTARVAGTFVTQRDAVAFARERARSAPRALVIHGRDGRIRQKSSYGH
jgi:hypothetical protein